MTKSRIQRSTGNVYKDLAFPNAEEMQAKAVLASSILSIIEKKKWTQQEAGKILGITQPKVSLLSRGQFAGFSMEKLISLLNRLNQDVEIVIRAKPFSKKHTGHISVTHTFFYLYKIMLCTDLSNFTKYKITKITAQNLQTLHR